MPIKDPAILIFLMFLFCTTLLIATFIAIDYYYRLKEKRERENA